MYFNPIILWHLSKKNLIMPTHQLYSLLHTPLPLICSSSPSPQLGCRALTHHLNCVIVKVASAAQLRQFWRDQLATSALSLSFFPSLLVPLHFLTSFSFLFVEFALCVCLNVAKEILNQWWLQKIFSRWSLKYLIFH